MRTVERYSQFSTRQWLSGLMLVALLFSVLPGSLQAREGERLAAQEDATAILLGEYVQQPATADDVFAYAIYLPEEGEYMISPDDDEAAQDFEAALFDVQGEAVYEGPLAMEAVALAAGEYTLQVTALNDSFLSFFVLGMIGGMSDRERTPGKLYAGSVYAEEDVSEARYATVSIPEMGYPQEVLLFFQAGQRDTFSLSVEGESVSQYVNSDDTEMVRFYSEGGSYTLTVDAWDRRSNFTAIVFLAGAPVQLELDGAIEATLAADADTQIFRLSLDDVYDDVTVTLSPASDSEAELSMSIVDRYEGGNFYVYSESNEDGSLTASTGALLPGDYYVVVTSYDGLNTDYTLSADAVVGAPMLALPLDEASAGTLEEGDVQYYRLDGVEAGTFLRITLSSSVEGNDFDLHVGMVQPLDQWSSTGIGPNEEVILVAPSDGDYYVQVLSYSGAGDYELLAEEVAGVGLIDANQLILQSIDEDGYTVYGFAIDKPGQLLSVLLASQDAADLDLSVIHFGPKGTLVHDLSSVSAGSSEIVSQPSADAGIYEARVRAFGTGGDFVLLVRVEDPVSFLEGSSQISPSEATVLLTDDFSDSNSGWAIDEEDGAYGYADGAYQITAGPGVYRWVVQDDEAFADISLELEFAMTSGGPDAYAGLICRSTDVGYFYADISPAGDFSIGQIIGSEVVVLSEWADNAAIASADSAVNFMRLDCIGDTITAYVNGEVLASVSVEATAGGFGFEVGNTKGATEAATFIFDNLELSQP